MMRVQPLLDRLQCVTKQLGLLAVVPGPVVAAERMMVRDRPARVDHSFRSGGFHRPKLLDQFGLVAKRVPCEVWCRSIWI
jgi:hypothetical protein